MIVWRKINKKDREHNRNRTDIIRFADARLYPVLAICSYVRAEGIEPTIHADYVIYSHTPHQLEHYSQFCVNDWFRANSYGFSDHCFY